MESVTDDVHVVLGVHVELRPVDLVVGVWHVTGREPASSWSGWIYKRDGEPVGFSYRVYADGGEQWASVELPGASTTDGIAIAETIVRGLLHDPMPELGGATFGVDADRVLVHGPPGQMLREIAARPWGAA